MNRLPIFSSLQRNDPTLTDILSILNARLPDLKARFGVRSLGVFGSYVRGQEKRGSDLDLLVEFWDAKPSYRDFDGLQHDLSKLLGIKVDLVPRAQLKPHVGRRVMEEVVDVAAPEEGLSRLDALRAEGKLSRPRDLRDSLTDILEQVGNAHEFVRGLDFETFSRDTRTVRATLHALLIIGEATRNPSPPLRRRYPDVPWPKIVGLRNRVAHAYFPIELPNIWNTIHRDLPQLRDVAARILADLEREKD